MVQRSRTFTADRGDGGVRIDIVVCRHLADEPWATRTRVQASIRSGRLTINRRPVTRVAARVAIGDVVDILVPPGATRATPAPENRPLDVLYEDAHLIAVAKPAGMVVHPSYKHPDGTLFNAVLWRARTWDEGQRPSLVGRLDKDTSGIVIVAKTSAVHARLQRAMRCAAKDYIAVVYGRTIPGHGRIELALGRDPLDRRRVVASGGGRESVTQFIRLDRAAAPHAGLALLRCRPVTGRMHQIRVHLAARGWPIVGDPTYGEPRWREVVDPALAAALRNFPRQALHAVRVTFDHPESRGRIVIDAPLPADITALLAATGLTRSSLSGGNVHAFSDTEGRS